MEKNSKTKKEANKMTPKQKKKFVIILSVVLIVAVIAAVGIAVMLDNGVFARASVIKKSDKISVNGAMMTFYFWDTVNSSLENFSGYYSSNGLKSVDDLDKLDPLGKTWREGFEKTTSEMVDLYLSYAEYAAENGISLDDTDKKDVEKEISKIRSKSELFGISLTSYLSKYYGRGVKESDVRDAISLAYLSTKGFNAMYDSINVSDEEIEKYFGENKREFERADYCFFVTGISGKNTLTEPEKKYYSEKAEYISESQTIDTFKERVAEYLKEENNRYPLDSDKRLSKEELETLIEETLNSLIYKGVGYDKTIEFHNWVFSDERMPGDTTVNHKDPYGTYGVIYIVSPVYIDENWKESAESAILRSAIEELIKGIDEKHPASSEKLTKTIAGLAK